MGIVSSIGNNVSQTYLSLSEGKTGIAPIKHLQTVHKDEFVAGEVPLSNDGLSKLAGVKKSYNRTTLLGIIAAKEACTSAKMKKSESLKTGFVSSTTVAGMCNTELFYKEFFEGKPTENFIDSHYCGVSSSDIAKETFEFDFISTISTACSSAANAIMFGGRAIRLGLFDRVVVGGTDALSKFTLNGFNSLMILDKEWCKPFDENRKGLNLGEGAAYLVLESEKSLKETENQPIGELIGYGNANDAFHQTASSEEGFGATLAMKKALKVANISPEKIDYVNAHGTATPNNDESEGKALKALFGAKVPPFSSTKAFTGHTLAAAASIEAVISLLSLKHNQVFPNLNQKVNISSTGLEPVRELKSIPIHYVLSNSFGFGGNCSSLILKKYSA